MKKINEVINRKIFLNAFDICTNQFNKDFVLDINLLLLKDKFSTYTENNIGKYYDEIICNDVVYLLPELFSGDIVNIPKGINGIREYRFFSMFSMILYNSVGLLLIDLCNENLNNLKFSAENVFSFSPTRFIKQDDCWKAINDYQKEYLKYTEKVSELIKPGVIVLKIDISRYFNSISHKILLDIIEEYSLKSTLGSYDYDLKTRESILYYFNSMMTSDCGIPQGRKNLVSDYFGNLYLKRLDEEIKQLCKSEILEYESMIRYVDDGIIIFENNRTFSNSQIYKELSQIEHKISKFLLKELYLTLNNKKSEYYVINSEKDVEAFLEENNKKISTKPNEKESVDSRNIEKKYNKFVKAIEHYKFNSENTFNFGLSIVEKENLKGIYNESLKKILKKQSSREEVLKIIKQLDIELTVDSIYMIIALFFLKDKDEYIFLEPLEKYFKSDLKKIDRRAIHILFMAVTQGYDLRAVNKIIKENKEQLLDDSYGRYLLLFNKSYKYDEKLSFLSENAIFNRLSWENNVKKGKKFSKKFFPETSEKFYLLIIKIIKYKKYNDALIEQLKNFVFFYRRKEWDLSFNYFYNFFHEICKLEFNVKDSNSVLDIISILNRKALINSKDEMTLRKFSDRRNFNPVSHSSKNGSKSIKVSYEDVEKFMPKIIEILDKII